MPVKHQTASYRTRRGVRYVCDGDILDTAAGDLKSQARDRVAALRAQGRPAFYERHAGGAYYRVFVAEPTETGA